MGKTVLPLFLGFDRILFILADKDDIHKSLGEFKIRPDLTRTTELAALKRLKNGCYQFFSIAIYPIHSKIVGTQNMYNIFEI